MARMILPARIEEIGTGVEFIEERLKKYRIKDRDRLKAMLVAEEAMVRLVNNASEDAELQMSVTAFTEKRA